MKVLRLTGNTRGRTPIYFVAANISRWYSAQPTDRRDDDWEPTPNGSVVCCQHVDDYHFVAESPQFIAALMQDDQQKGVDTPFDTKAT